jgi:hypothetical protein
LILQKFRNHIIGRVIFRVLISFIAWYLRTKLTKADEMLLFFTKHVIWFLLINVSFFNKYLWDFSMNFLFAINFPYLFLTIFHIHTLDIKSKTVLRVHPMKDSGTLRKKEILLDSINLLPHSPIINNHSYVKKFTPHI